MPRIFAPRMAALRLWHVFAVHLLLCTGLVGPAAVAAQSRDVSEPDVYPVLGRPDVAPLAIGGTAVVAGFLIPIDVQPVPPQGLDAAACQRSLAR